jgi:Rad3-related DNA helicase
MQVLDFEHRAEQTEMAMAVVDSLQDGTHLLFEAGTGSGEESGLSNPIPYPRGP